MGDKNPKDIKKRSKDKQKAKVKVVPASVSIEKPVEK